MEGDLLLKEQELYKINSELEERTSRILQEIEASKKRVAPLGCVTKDQRVPVPAHSKTFSFKNDSGVTSRGEKGSAEDTLVKSDRVDDPLALRSNGLGYEATNRLLRAKLTILNKEVDTLRQEHKSKTEELRRTTADLNYCDEERAKLESSLLSTRESAATLQGKLESITNSLTRANAENSSLVKELASLKKELKQQRQQTSTVELRLNRALEDAEKLRAAAKQAQLQQKDEREKQRSIADQLQSKLKGVERQRTELMSVCNKQVHLIDNLRRQKTHLEATRFIFAAEQEFDNMLDWCLKNEKEPTTERPS